MGILFTVIVATVIDNVPVMAVIAVFGVSVVLTIMLCMVVMVVAIVILHHNVHFAQFDVDDGCFSLCCHGSQPQHCYGCQPDDVLFHIACMIWLRLMLFANG